MDLFIFSNKSPSIVELNLKWNNFLELGAEHPNICRLEIECLMEGAEHRNISLVTVLCTFENAGSIFLQILSRLCRFPVLLYSRLSLKNKVSKPYHVLLNLSSKYLLMKKMSLNLKQCRGIII